jgi:hypothetical protein
MRVERRGLSMSMSDKRLRPTDPFGKYVPICAGEDYHHVTQIHGRLGRLDLELSNVLELLTDRSSARAALKSANESDVDKVYLDPGFARMTSPGPLALRDFGHGLVVFHFF